MSATANTTGGALEMTQGTDDEHADESAAAATPRTLTEDELYHVLQCQRRRDALRYLQGTDEPVRMRELAEQVAAWEHDTTLHALTSQERQRVYIPLYQSHLPKLDEVGVIRYNQSRGVVERTPLADQLDPYLDGPTAAGERGDGTDGGWNAYYLAAAGVSALLLGAAAVGLPGVAGATTGLLVLLTFALVTVGSVLDEGASAPHSRPADR